MNLDNVILLSQENFNIKFKEFKECIKRDYVEELCKMKNTMIKIASENGIRKCKITVDKDFDGLASARNCYHLSLMMGINSVDIDFVFLDSSHSYDFKDRLENQIIFITDTSINNINLVEKDCTVIWLDHHITNRLQELKMISKIRNQDWVYANARSSKNEEIRNMSCGMFSLIFFLCAIEDLGIDQSLINEMSKRLMESCYQDSAISLISDETPTELYPYLINQIKETPKTEIYTSLKGVFFNDNKKFYKNYIAKINNVIRMNQHFLLENIIRDEVSYNVIDEISRLEEDKKSILKYFKTAKPTHSYTEGRIVQFYRLPFEENETIKNFKGVLASLKIPKNNGKFPFIIMSYYVDKKTNMAHMSCRTNQTNMDLFKELKSTFSKVEGGGHQKAFGLKIPAELLNSLFQFCCSVKLDTTEDKSLKFDSYMDAILLSKIALYNEFSRDQMVLLVDKMYLKNKQEEPKRTVYSLYVKGSKRPLKVVSFSKSDSPDMYLTPRVDRIVDKEVIIELCE